MQDFELEAYAKAKLTAFRREPGYAPHRQGRSWRSRTAHLLRNLADGLEPLPVQPTRLRA